MKNCLLSFSQPAATITTSLFGACSRNTCADVNTFAWGMALFLTWWMYSVRAWVMHLSHFGKLLKHICRFLSLQQPASEIRGCSQIQIDDKETKHVRIKKRLSHKVWLASRRSVCEADRSALIYSTFRAYRANWITQSGQMRALRVWVIGLSCFS